MRTSTQWLFKIALMTALGGALNGTADADCLRHVYNRSPYTLVVAQDDGPSFSVRPGSSRSIRLAAPGKLDVTAYCSRAGLGEPIAQRSFAYQAVLDRCFFEVGHRFFQRELGPGFLPRRAEAPFTLNNPRQGDLVVFARRSECSVLR